MAAAVRNGSACSRNRFRDCYQVGRITHRTAAICSKAASRFAYYCSNLIAVLFSPSMNRSGPQIKSARQSRRSARVVLSVPVQVHGRDVFGEAFHEFTTMRSVNAHGGLLALAARVQKGQTILVANRNTREEKEFRVVNVGPAQCGKWTVGIEFVQPPANFWHIHFPSLISRRFPDAEN